MPADFDRFPRFHLLDGPTPIRRLQRLEEALGERAGGVALYLKHDDVTPVGGGGNKLRKLEFLIGDALAQKADTIVTFGGLQSNHARLTAAASARANLGCELVLAPMVPRDDLDYRCNGNVLLDQLFGAHVHVLPPAIDALTYSAERVDQLRALGRRAYLVPIGGSSPVGCLGYARCVAEIVSQSTELGINFDQVIVPNGSAGTHAGLIVGFTALGLDARVTKSYTVLAPRERARAATLEKAQAAADLLGAGMQIEPSVIDIDGDHLGDGYGVPTKEMISTVRLLARTEGLLLDPVYSGKAFAGMLHDIASGRYKPGQKLLFIMTGGLPGLFAYRTAFDAFDEAAVS